MATATGEVGLLFGLDGRVVGYLAEGGAFPLARYRWVRDLPGALEFDADAAREALRWFDADPYADAARLGSPRPCRVAFMGRAEAAEWERQDRMARPEMLNPQRQSEFNEAMA